MSNVKWRKEVTEFIQSLDIEILDERVNGKHRVLHLRNAHGETKKLTTPMTPSCRRGIKNMESLIKRFSTKGKPMNEPSTAIAEALQKAGVVKPKAGELTGTVTTHSRPTPTKAEFQAHFTNPTHQSNVTPKSPAYSFMRYRFLVGSEKARTDLGIGNGKYYAILKNLTKVTDEMESMAALYIEDATRAMTPVPAPATTPESIPEVDLIEIDETQPEAPMPTTPVQETEVYALRLTPAQAEQLKLALAMIGAKLTKIEV